MADSTLTLGAGKAASITGVSKDLMRHYERIGILAAPPRTAGGYRQYSNDHVERVILIQKAVAVGFALEELRDLLYVRDNGGAPCNKVRDTLLRKRDELDQKLAELQRIRDELNAILADWDVKLRQTPAGSRSHLLQSLPPREPSRRKP